MPDTFHMRLVASDLLDEAKPINPVCIDVVLRGDFADIARLAPRLRTYLEADGMITGQWAGIGRGALVEGPVTLG